MPFWFDSGHGIPGARCPQGMTPIYRQAFNAALWTYVVQGKLAATVSNGGGITIFSHANWVPSIEKGLTFAAGQGGYYTGSGSLLTAPTFIVEALIVWTGATGDIGPISIRNRAQGKRAGSAFQTHNGDFNVIAPPYNGSHVIPKKTVAPADWAETKNVFACACLDNQQFPGQGTRIMTANVLLYGN